jgi:exodeoxyribonuclease VII small subunit
MIREVFIMANEEQKPLTEEQVSKMTFEQAIDTLTGIVENIEGGEIGLEQSLAQYEQGMAMIKHCRKILTQAEKRIEKLTQKDS